MNALLFKKAQASIAFDFGVADDINKIIATIDARLYSFAYYSPVVLQNTSAHACFYLAVINMYSLLWDCGPMLNSILYDLNCRYRKIPPNLRSELATWKPLDIMRRTIANIRSDVCHNNSAEYYFNKSSHHEHYSFLSTNVGKHFTVKSQFAEKDWEIVCEKFLAMCNDFSNTYRSVLLNLKKVPPKEIADFTTLWLGYIGEWYKRNKDISFSVLGDLYPLSISNKGKVPSGYDLGTLYRWISRNWTPPSGGLASPKEICHAYIKATLDNSLDTHLCSPHCPEPALPKHVLYDLFKPTALTY